ncbi:putative MFS transporter [Thermoascus aurantiacus ATCC 26904]
MCTKETRSSDLTFVSDAVQLPPLQHTTERNLILKIDLRVIPCPTILFLLCFLDRTNIGNASIYGLREELHMSDLDYSTALTMFYIPYILFEIPSNILLKKLSPHVWLSICMFGFGIVTLCTGFIRSYGGLLALRFLLGLAEAGMVPGNVYLMGAWYKRSEAQRRFAFFFSSASLAGAFSGLLAAAIGNMNGMRGYAGWRWIFILEGAASCAVAVVCFFFLADFPENTKWLTEEEREYVKARLKIEQGSSGIEYSIKARDVLNTFRDPKIFIGGLLHFSATVPSYMGSYFAPVIISSLGYTQIGTQLHTAPPWLVTFALQLIAAYISDKFQHRYLLAMFGVLLAIAGYAVLLTVHHNNQAQYGALFLAFGGTHLFIPIEVCWFALNLGGHRRRAVGTAWQVGFGNIGGIIASYSFRSRDAPEYRFEYTLSIGFCCFSAVMCSIYAFACWYQNRRRAAKGWGAELTEAEKTDMGDMSPSYKYLL